MNLVGTPALFPATRFSNPSPPPSRTLTTYQPCNPQTDGAAGTCPLFSVSCGPVHPAAHRPRATFAPCTPPSLCCVTVPVQRAPSSSEHPPARSPPAPASPFPWPCPRTRPSHSPSLCSPSVHSLSPFLRRSRPAHPPRPASPPGRLWVCGVCTLSSLAFSHQPAPLCSPHLTPPRSPELVSLCSELALGSPAGAGSTQPPPTQPPPTGAGSGRASGGGETPGE